MSYNNNFYLSFFKKVCKKNSYNFKSLSHNYIFEIKNKSGEKFYIYGNALPLNNNIAQKICADKSALSKILMENNIPCVEHILIKNPKALKTFTNKEIKKYISKHKHVVIKDNKGYSGNFVFKTNKFSVAKKYVNLLFKNYKDACISPFIDYKDEYRLIFLDNNCEIIYKKVRAFVTGDGKTKLKTLIESKYGEEFLKENKVKYLYKKPKQGETVTISWKHNLKHFAYPETNINENIKSTLIDIAKKSINLLKLRFCSVDIIDDNSNFKILEINSIVSISKYSSKNKYNYAHAQQVFTKAIKKCFEQKEV